MTNKRKLRTGIVLHASKDFFIFTAEEFIAAITQHIPERSSKVVPYHGWYSSRMLGERRKSFFYVACRIPAIPFYGVRRWLH
ncbi:MAG: transposase [Proteobacteria bacterium]|nr:transposase [Pseudomonadota bacterium]MBU1420603.1 transposase [Pseudomonadota bacterium]MBU1455790.1 transposase [Pseudomonadota bacterium]